MLMSEAKVFSPKSADFLVTRKKEPRLNLRSMVNLEKSENATAIIAANALRTHQNISVSGEANIANGLFVNGIDMSYEHNGRDAFDENKATFID